MDQISIKTTQNVAIDYEVATLLDRGVALLIDYGVILLYYMIFTIMMNAAGYWDWQSDQTIVTVFLVPPSLYAMMMEIFFNGKTVGKMVMRIKVIKVDGSRPSVGSIVIRNLLRVVDSLLWFWTVGAFTILATGTGQRLGDLAARTSVVRTQRRKRLYDTILHRIDPNYIPVFPQVAALTDRDIATIKDVMIICSRTRNWEALRMLTARTKEVMQVETSMPDFQFLNTVIKDYTNYSFD